MIELQLTLYSVLRTILNISNNHKYSFVSSFKATRLISTTYFNDIFITHNFLLVKMKVEMFELLIASYTNDLF